MGEASYCIAASYCCGSEVATHKYDSQWIRLRKNNFVARIENAH
jgi:hypothetical protein